MERLSPVEIPSSPLRRHEARVQRVSQDYARLRRLDRLVVGENDARRAVAAVCLFLGIPHPRLRFHARRSPFTGACEPPRTSPGPSKQAGVEGGRPTVDRSGTTEQGALRIGREVSLMTLAHELGHHAVHHLDRPGTPPHGKVWIHRFDQAAAVIAAMVDPVPS